MIGFFVWFQSLGCQCWNAMWHWLFQLDFIGKWNKDYCSPCRVDSYFCIWLIILSRVRTSMIQVFGLKRGGLNTKNSSFEVRHFGNFHFDLIPDCNNSTIFRIHYYYFESEGFKASNKFKGTTSWIQGTPYTYVYTVPKWKCVLS